MRTVRDRFYLHCIIAHDQKKTNGEVEEERRKKKKNQQTKLNRELSPSRIFSVNIYSSERETFWFFVYIPRKALEKMNIRGERASERLLVHFFSFFFSWFFKYNIDLYKIHKLFLTIQKWIDQKALLNFISTYFLKAHLLLLFFLFFFFPFLFFQQCSILSAVLL